jgi:hypothetical protein
MSKRTVNRLYAAIRIRDTALDKVEIDGYIDFNEFSLIKVWGNDEFYITFDTPFQKLPTIEDITDEDLAFFNLKNSLNIWDTKGKLFNIEWDDENHIDLLQFKRGKWEQKVLHHMM